MSLNSSSNCSAASYKHIGKTNPIKRQAQLNSVNQNFNNENIQQDTFQRKYFGSVIMNESVIKKNGNIFNDFVTEYSGSLNNKNISLLSKSEGLTIFANRNVQGAIGDKPIEFVYNNKAFSGNYNGVEFDLKFEKNNLLDFFANKKISGTINGEKFKLDLKNSSIPEDENTRDIITTFLMINGLAPKIKNGQLNGTKLSNWKQQEENEAAAFAMMNSTQPAVYNTYTPTWHYENPTCPTFY